MVFTIENEDYVFSLVVDQDNHLTGFTATKDQVTYDCSIHLKSQLNSQVILCCRPYPPGGCVEGPC